MGRKRHTNLLPRRIGRIPITDFVAERATRPRDVISFFNKCIEVAEGLPKLNVDTLRRAEGEYSRQRLRALGDEWNADYAGLLDFADILKKKSPSFNLGKLTYEEIADTCLRSAIEHPQEAGLLREHARNVVEGLIDVQDFKRTLFMVFYSVGLVGLKLDAFETASWVDELGQGVSPAEIDDDTGIVVHNTYRRALGITEGRSQRR